MARLIYSTMASLDGYVSDAEGGFAWAAPDEEVHQFVNDLEREIGTYLYGRRMYEVMVAWETMPEDPGTSSAMGDFTRIWRGADKIVYSRTLETVASARTRIERDFAPDEIRALKASSPHDLSVGGPDLAAEAFEAGLVDECHLLLAPVLVGGGHRALPGGVRLRLELLDSRRFTNGTVHLHYRVEDGGTTG